ncbi:hypothetical protein C5167_002380 [Papaver somniferum]|uniref:GPI inositol-deacylase n=1 Tax=Papaver somniferum TaxID=3469 RepID=A0A4Y7L1T9_PAPSO|nr:hypothetical protein C5167_002380 [Papaver somniferum]
MFLLFIHRENLIFLPLLDLLKTVMTEGVGVSLIGHSAGGWLARLYMEGFGTSNVSLLLTLGSPLSSASKRFTKSN